MGRAAPAGRILQKPSPSGRGWGEGESYITPNPRRMGHPPPGASPIIATPGGLGGLRRAEGGFQGAAGGYSPDFLAVLR